MHTSREKMIVSYYRYKGASAISNIDEVCKLCRATGQVPGSFVTLENTHGYARNSWSGSREQMSRVFDSRYVRFCNSSIVLRLHDFFLVALSPSPGGRRPPNYPEEYFSRLCIKKQYVNMIIGRYLKIHLPFSDFSMHTSFCSYISYLGVAGFCLVVL